jgi:hypothetical protein
MKERTIDRERAVITHHQASEVSQPSVDALHDPPPSVASQGSIALSPRPKMILLLWANQLDAATLQTLSQRIAVVCFVGDHPQRLLPRTARVLGGPLRASSRRVGLPPRMHREVVSQSKTAAVDHDHALRPLALLGFSDSAAPFFAGAKLPSRNDSLHSSCRRSFHSLRNGRQRFDPTPRSTESLSAHGGSRSTEGTLALFRRSGEPGRDFLPLRFGQQWTRPRHPSSWGAADLAYLLFQTTQP